MSSVRDVAVMDYVANNILKVDAPTLVLGESHGMSMTSESESLAIDNHQMAVLMVPGTYVMSSGTIRSHTVVPQTARATTVGRDNFVVNIRDCLHAARLLNREIPLCVVADKVICLNHGRGFDTGTRDRTEIFVQPEYTITSRDSRLADDARSEFNTLIVGAGPYGTSSALACKNAGIDALWVGEPLSFWLRNIQPTPLRSGRSATNLYTHRNGDMFNDFCDRYSLGREGKVAFWEFLAYYYDLILSMDLFPSHERVTEITRQGDAWLARLEGWSGAREVLVRNVINATGIGMHPHVPSFLKNLPSGVAGHVSQFAAGAFPSGERIAVIGGGQSAIEYALHAAARNDVTLYVRGKLVSRNLHQPSQVVFRYLASNCERYIRYLPTWLRNQVLAYLLMGTCEPESGVALENNGVALSECMSVTGCILNDDGKVVLAHQKGTETFDKVVVGTGYHYDVRNIDYLRNVMTGPRLISAGRFPRLDGNAMLQGVPQGMYFTGYACMHSHGFKSQFINGTQLIVKKIVQGIAEKN